MRRGVDMDVWTLRQHLLYCGLVSKAAAAAAARNIEKAEKGIWFDLIS